MSLKNLRQTYIFIGGPGSGKGTQSDLLQAELACQKIEVGSVLRQRAQTSDDLGKKIEDFMQAGQMIPDNLLQPILEPLITANQQQNLILDGYCRTVDQVKHIEDWLARGVIAPPLIIELAIDERKTLERITKRRYCGRCREIRYTATGQEICVICDGPLLKREDDNPLTFSERLHTYQTQSIPAKRRLAKRFTLITVDGDHPIDNVHHTIMRQLGSHGPH